MFLRALAPSWAALLGFISLCVPTTSALGAFEHANVSAASGPVRSETQFRWSSLPASERLEWQSCYIIYKCARLKVPLDYENPLTGGSAIIPVISLPSIFPKHWSHYRGPILFNPGGPGGSGVDLVLSVGPQLRTIVGPEFDIVSFDPRGIGRSFPKASFFETQLERSIWDLGVHGVMNATTDGVSRAWARALVNAKLAGERGGKTLRFLNTEFTARDMLKIVEAHGRERLQYWGFSYGTVLGATFAAMFPDKVERVILDGVVVPETYYDTSWSKNLLDTDKTMQSFFDSCHAAGPFTCPFYAPSPELISNNLTRLLESIKTTPIPVRTSKTYGLVDYNLIKMVIFGTLYRPYREFPILAKILADLANGDGSTLFDLLALSASPATCDGDTAQELVVIDAQWAIVCNDGDEIPGTVEDTHRYFNELVASSGWGQIWANIRTGCSGWPKMPKKYFRGPFQANTSFPILFIGNTADPVTPLWAAKETSKGFPGSIVLTQDSPGHCSLNAPSLCTARLVRRYFKDGTLPDVGTICPASSPILPLRVGDDGGLHHQAPLEATLTADDQQLLDAVRFVSEASDVNIQFPTSLRLRGAA